MISRNNVIPAKAGIHQWIPACAGMTTLALASCFFLTYPIVKWSRRNHWRYTGAGLIGTVAGLFFAPLLPRDALRCGLVLVGAFAVSVACSDLAEQLMGQKDDQRIVIDEWMGYLSSVAWHPRTPVLLLTAFVLFRIVDVWKPLGIRHLSVLQGGLGVVMDDFVGGLLVNAILWLLPLS